MLWAMKRRIPTARPAASKWSALGAQAVGHGGKAVGVPHLPQARVALEGGELVDNHLRLGLGHGTGDRVGIERVGHHRLGKGPEHVGLGRRAGHADHVVARGGELGDELAADRTGGSSDEHFHGCLLPDPPSGGHSGGHL
jgi:hypothetical protein